MDTAKTVVDGGVLAVVEESALDIVTLDIVTLDIVIDCDNWKTKRTIGYWNFSGNKEIIWIIVFIKTLVCIFREEVMF